MRYANSGYAGLPDALYAEVRWLTDVALAAALADQATQLARRLFPKVSGASAADLQPFYGVGFFGIHWTSPVVWFQEAGTKPRTMRSLAGKTIPMWVDDPRGTLRKKNPKAQTRITRSGKAQTLIFRRAARQGQRRPDGSVASYPGAPGRIASREASRPNTSAGKVGGAIALGNVGVRWRHPGLGSRNVIRHSVMTVAARHGIRAGIRVRDLGRT